jgi:hypothetical protein
MQTNPNPPIESMKTRQFIPFAVAALVAVDCQAGPAVSTNSTATFEWSKRPELSLKQQELLHLYTNLEGPQGEGEKRPGIEAKIDQLKQELGTNTVRHARANELVVKPTGRTNEVSVFNPSKENVAFTISVRGDEEWMGSRMASLGRKTFLPPHGTLLVTNLYWTTPRMDMRK